MTALIGRLLARLTHRNSDDDQSESEVWACDKCGALNPYSVLTCYRCGA